MIIQDANNKWQLVVKKNGKIINYIAVPPTDGNRIDIITNSDLLAGYNYNIDCVIIVIEEGKISKIMETSSRWYFCSCII